MKKFILPIVMALTVMFTANAQVATENAKVFDNTYVSVEVGASTPLNFNSMFPVNPMAGIKAGKELTPVFGLEVEGLTIFGDNFYRNGVNGSIMGAPEGSFNLHKNGKVNTFIKATNVGLNGVLNWSNVLFGYNGAPRTFEVKTNTGLGWLHYFGTYNPKYPIGGYVVCSKKNALVAKTAVDFAFNLGKAKQHTINVSPTIYWNLSESGAIQFNKNYAQIALMAGYTYHFKTSNGTRHFKTYNVGDMIAENERLNAELAKKSKVVEKVVIKEVPVIKEATGFGIKETVFFAFDSAELDQNAKETLDKLGQNGVYVVRGYASSEGSTEYNKALSLKRAEAVAQYLRDRGARVDTVEGLGVVFGPTTGRVAVVTNK